MYEAAKKDGITLKIISATRNFSSQKGIWEAKWTGERIVEGKNLAKDVKDTVERAKIILHYSSMPGTSRHHWGTDIDINDLNDSYFTSGQGKKEYEWLVKNAPAYGFCQPYSPKGAERPNGYEEEKWHWSYMPVSRELARLYPQKVQYPMINGFKGCGTAASIDVIRNYVGGVSADCVK
jgi:LAS superfamily LD-carboxypeptidase LdcB